MIVNELGLHKINNHQWYFQMGSVLENKGIDEAMDWISDQLPDQTFIQQEIAIEKVEQVPKKPEIEKTIVLLGCGGSGKTTLLYRLKLGELVSTIPTIGFNVETLEYEDHSYTIFDLGGNKKMKPLWKHYY